MSWRRVIRGTCLGLLGLCVGVWGLSYFYEASASRLRATGQGTAIWGEGELLTLSLSEGVLRLHTGPTDYDRQDPVPIWRGSIGPRIGDSRFRLHLLDEDFLGFYVQLGVPTQVYIPLWFPSVLLGLVSLLAWRKTRKPARGFPLEPLASRRETLEG